VTHRRIHAQSIRVVDILVAGQAAIDRLPQHCEHGVLRVPTVTEVGQHRVSLLRQTERFIQFTKRKQPCIARNPRSVEFEPEFAIELNAKYVFSPVTH
jgi:hypothetical protein